MKAKFTAILRFEEDMHVAYTPELDIASQGQTQREALENLKEEIEGGCKRRILDQPI